MTHHLSEAQLANALIAGSTDLAANSATQAHLRACPACSAALAELREPLALFRAAASSFAEREYEGVQPSISSHPQPTMFFRPAWLAMAAMALLVLLLSRGMYERRAAPASQSALVQPQTMESDEALLSEINQDIAASVPSPMQPLADPTHRAAYAQDRAQSRTAQRRKSE